MHLSNLSFKNEFKQSNLFKIELNLSDFEIRRKEGKKVITTFEFLFVYL